MATEHDTQPAPQAVADAIDHLGGDSAVARLLNVRPWAISKWRKRLPPSRVLWLAEQTGWKFTPHQLAPDLYPHETDGLPQHLKINYSAIDDTQHNAGGSSERKVKEARAV